jgi:tRNA(fMet)-specific endonuclease VapC
MERRGESPLALVLVLDTDHFSALKDRANSRREALPARMASSEDTGFALATMTLEEQTRGWLAKSHAARGVHRRMQFYSMLVNLFRFTAAWPIATFDTAAGAAFERLRRDGVRIGSMVLKIAAITLAAC